MKRMQEEKTSPQGEAKSFYKRHLFSKRKFDEATPHFSKSKAKESQGSSSKKGRMSTSVICFQCQQKGYYTNDYRNEEVTKKVSARSNFPQ